MCVRHPTAYLRWRHALCLCMYECMVDSMRNPRAVGPLLDAVDGRITAGRRDVTQQLIEYIGVTTGRRDVTQCHYRVGYATERRDVTQLPY
ncbi:unnamed protein product [Linum trigynum]|uniref:Uncharacterized protein n=1 Tax=Linum trigynum TaxID=586398 RepID=A0AAV2FZ82_9ROSI